MKITAYGSAGEVTGSNFLLETHSGTQCLIDFGLFQGPPAIEAANHQALDFNPAELDFVLLTHAHMDHSGRLPLLVKHGFSGPIYMSYPTRDLVEALLLDSAEIQASSEAPLYTKSDVFSTLALIYPLAYNDPITQADVTFSFHQSGHLLGSAFIKVQADGQRIAFSGDIGRFQNGFYPDPEAIGAIDYLVCESTYGNSLHRPKADAYHELLEAIFERFEQGRTIIIPSFSVGRTTEILHGLRQLASQTGRIETLDRIPFYLDSPLGLKALDIYRQRSEYLAANFNPSYLEGPQVRLLHEPAQSYGLDQKHEPKVIISSGGMAQGGHILHHLEAFLPQASTSVIFVGYQSEATLGRALLEGQKEVAIQGNKVLVEAEILPISGFSGHGDQADLLRWIETGSAQDIFLVHGEPPVLADWQHFLHDRGYTAQVMPRSQTIDLS